MPQIPQYTRTTTLNGSAMPYQNYNITADTSGASIGAAMSNTGKEISRFGASMERVQNTVEEAKILELSNNIDQWEQDNLYNKDSGYYYKIGKDAVGKSSEVMKNYDDFVKQYTSNYKISPTNQQRMNMIIARKRSRISYGVNAHDVKQTAEYAKIEGQKGTDNAITGMIHARNDYNVMEGQLKNGLKVIEWQGEIQNLDKDTVDALKKSFKSTAYEAVLNTYISEGDLRAGEFFNKHKEDISPAKHSEYIGRIKREEQKYKARSLADNLFISSADEADAFKKLESQKSKMDIEQYDDTYRRLAQKFSQKRHIEDVDQDEKLNQCYENINNAIKNNEPITNDLIVQGLNGKNEIAMRKYISDIATKGDVETKADVYMDLYQMSVNDAQNFQKMNLAQYRPYLSESDYKSLEKRKIELQNFTPTQIQDDNKIIQNAIETFGLIDNRPFRMDVDGAFINAAKSYIREIELKRGKNLTHGEIENLVFDFAKTMNYENPEKKQKMYRLWADGMNEQAWFTRNVLNDWESAKKLKGSDLTDEEKYNIVQKRVSKTIQEQNKSILETLTPREVKEGDIWQGHRITSPFGKRTAPKQGATTDHKGIDLAYNNNEKFQAFAGGTVVNIGNDKDLGKFVDIKSADGTIHRYGHANQILVSTGEKIQTGKVIGLAGSTGNSTGPHLHYAKIKNGRFINPVGVVAEEPQNGWAF